MAEVLVVWMLVVVVVESGDGGFEAVWECGLLIGYGNVLEPPLSV